MTHKKTVSIIRRFLKKIQAWVDKTPGADSVWMNIDDRAIFLAKNHYEKRGSKNERRNQSTNPKPVSKHPVR
ncbi:hypothetical protein ES703_63465 [subsurface metagenome]